MTSRPHLLENLLYFDSNFECGNLDCSYLVSNTESLQIYNLYLRPDTNSKGKQMWFMFACTGMRAGQ